jgi:hypothetical protein
MRGIEIDLDKELGKLAPGLRKAIKDDSLGMLYKRIKAININVVKKVNSQSPRLAPFFKLI